MKNIDKAIKVLGIHSGDIKDVSQSKNLLDTELHLVTGAVVIVSKANATITQDNKTITSVKFK